MRQSVAAGMAEVAQAADAGENAANWITHLAQGFKLYGVRIRVESFLPLAFHAAIAWPAEQAEGGEQKAEG